MEISRNYLDLAENIRSLTACCPNGNSAFGEMLHPSPRLRRTRRQAQHDSFSRKVRHQLLMYVQMFLYLSPLTVKIGECRGEVILFLILSMSCRGTRPDQKKQTERHSSIQSSICRQSSIHKAALYIAILESLVIPYAGGAFCDVSHSAGQASNGVTWCFAASYGDGGPPPFFPAEDGRLQDVG